MTSPGARQNGGGGGGGGGALSSVLIGCLAGWRRVVSVPPSLPHHCRCRSREGDRHRRQMAPVGAKCLPVFMGSKRCWVPGLTLRDMEKY